MFANTIEKYSPGRAAQIRTRYPRSQNSNSSAMAMGNAAYTAAVAVNTAANAMSTDGDEYDMVQDLPSNAKYGPNKARRDREQADEKAMQDVMSLSGKELPKEEREKIVARARKIVAETPDRAKKITGLSMLAGHVAAAGDKELAAEIMKDAAAFVNPNPRNYQDFLFNWMLAGGYASADPEKAYPLLQDTISRANETIEAFVKVAEFIDVSGEMVADGEVQVGAFGSSMIRGLTGELGIADSTVKLLARADFEKTCGLANRFDRPEVRMLARMMVLRAVLDEKKAEKRDLDY